MSDDELGTGGSDEDRLRGRLRLVSIAVILGCIVFLVLIDALGRLFVNPEFHVGDILFGTVIGAFLLLVGVEGAARFPWGGPK